MKDYKFESQKEFNSFVSKINIIDVILAESSSKVYSLSLKNQTPLETTISLGNMVIEIIGDHENKANFLVICTLNSDMEIAKNNEKCLQISTKIQALYRVSDLNIENEDITNTVKIFVENSAYTHIISFLRVYLMDIINKSGYPRYTLPLFKQLKDEKYEEKKD